MKKIGLLILLLAAPLMAQQNSNSVTVQVVAPPSWTITVAPGSYYQGKAATMTITVTAGVVSAGCTATWDSTALPLTFPSVLNPDPISLTAAVSAAMTATLGSHTVFITCPIPPLSMNTPVTFPNATVGVSYTASLSSLTGLSGGIPPYTWALVSGALPIGLSLTSSSGLITGIPSSSGSFNFGFTVTDSSGVATIWNWKLPRGKKIRFSE